MAQIDNVSQLSWILDFTQTEWSSLSREQKGILNIRLSHLYDSLLLNPTGAKNEAPVSGMFTEEEIIKIQTELKEVFFPSVGGTVIELPRIRRLLKVPHHGSSSYQMLWQTEEPFEHLNLKSVNDLSDKSEYWAPIINYVAESIISLPKDSIKKCVKCKKLFIHVSKKKKIYCSSPCAWRRLSQLRRVAIKKNPKQYKAYLKKQREAMRKIYEKRRKAEMGGKVRHRKEG